MPAQVLMSGISPYAYVIWLQALPGADAVRYGLQGLIIIIIIKPCPVPASSMPKCACAFSQPGSPGEHVLPSGVMRVTFTHDSNVTRQKPIQAC
jgi:hypothetical protein